MKQFIRYFTPSEYEEQTRDFFYSGKLVTSDGGEIRVKENAMYLFNPKYNTIPNVIVGKYLGCGPVESGTRPATEQEIEANFK